MDGGGMRREEISPPSLPFEAEVFTLLYLLPPYYPY